MWKGSWIRVSCSFCFSLQLPFAHPLCCPLRQTLCVAAEPETTNTIHGSETVPSSFWRPSERTDTKPHFWKQSWFMMATLPCSVSASSPVPLLLAPGMENSRASLLGLPTFLLSLYLIVFTIFFSTWNFFYFWALSELQNFSNFPEDKTQLECLLKIRTCLHFSPDCLKQNFWERGLITCTFWPEPRPGDWPALGAPFTPS